MRFDDRLQTLIDAPIADTRDRAVRWRQLVDLLARAGPVDASGPAATALKIVEEEAVLVDAEVRAATVRGIAGAQLPAPLLKILAAQPLAIAAPLFAGRTISAEDAPSIFADADPALRSLARIAPPAAAAPAGNAAYAEVPSIGAMVDRIEQLRMQRDSVQVAAPAREPRPAATASTPGRLFEWESDSTGHIAWVEGAPRGALVGRPLGGEATALLDRRVEPRIAHRHPFIDVPLVQVGALEGKWAATAAPAFDPTSGRFLGYRGVARRLDGPTPTRPSVEARADEGDSLRELVHEIKTPLNAIIGFAEIIDGQYLGPAHVRYRDRAAEIVGQARKLLDAVEDLDFAAALRAGRVQLGSGSRLADLFPKLSEEIEARLQIKGAGLELDLDQDRHRCALSPALAERLGRRLLLAVCDLVGPGETCRVAVSSSEGRALLMVARPHALDGYEPDRLVDPAFDPAQSEASGGIALGFALRLVRGLARVAGGDLRIDAHRLVLALPLIDA